MAFIAHRLAIWFLAAAIAAQPPVVAFCACGQGNSRVAENPSACRGEQRACCSRDEAKSAKSCCGSPDCKCSIEQRETPRPPAVPGERSAAHDLAFFLTAIAGITIEPAIASENNPYSVSSGGVISASERCGVLCRWLC
jgi:hypothetical protein